MEGQHIHQLDVGIDLMEGRTTSDIERTKRRRKTTRVDASCAFTGKGKLDYGDRVASVRPTFCLQTFEDNNRNECPSCSQCLKPLGSLSKQLRACAGKHRIAQLFEKGKNNVKSSTESKYEANGVSGGEGGDVGGGGSSRSLSASLPLPAWAAKLETAENSGNLEGEREESDVYFCPRGCGTAFCSKACWELADSLHHEVLCVGPCTEEDPAYKFKLVTLQHGLLIYDLTAQVVVSLAKGNTGSLPSFVGKEETLEPLMNFWDYVEDFGWNLADCYRDQVEDRSMKREEWHEVTKECWNLLGDTLVQHKEKLPDASLYQARGVDFFAKLATWVDINCISVDHLSPSGKYIDFLLSNFSSSEIETYMNDSEDLKGAIEALLNSLDEEEEENGPGKVSTLQEENENGTLPVPSVNGLVLWNGMGYLTHTCKPSVAMSFDPLAGTIEIQANHLLHPNAMMTRCYCRSDDTHSEILRFIGRNGMRCICNTCKTREYLERDKHLCVHQVAMLDMLGEVAFEEERYEDACLIYERRLQIEREDGEIWHKYGRALVNRGLWSKGYEVWERGWELMEKLGFEHKELNTLMAAQKYYRKGIGSKFDSNGTCVLYNSFEEKHLRSSAFLVDSVVMPLIDCRQIIEESEAYAKQKKGWSTKRHYSVPTTDVPAHELKATLGILNKCLERYLFPAIAEKFGEQEEDLQVHDAFVIKYSMNGQKFLPIHTDQSHYSATIGLNSVHDYQEGGLVFVGQDNDASEGRIVRVDEGKAIIFKGGEVSHGGQQITGGVRYIIALFIFSHNCKHCQNCGDNGCC